MQFRFDPHQDYQVDAIESVAGLLEGQPPLTVDLRLAGTASLAAIPNRLDLDAATLLRNLQAVQQAHALSPDAALLTIEAPIETVEGPVTARFPNFSVEMETGTGKTYVYLRTALELYRRYRLRKFIIVVPSIAIREGVLKTLQMTESHLRQLYDNTPYRYYSYDSANLSQIRQFALSDSVELMVMTIDSFNRASNVIRQSTDRLQGETPIHLVQATRPILILDEPQNMESELRVQALAGLNPLLALRYSATHRNPYNLIYRLTPFEAYRQGLVKRIEVAGIEREQDANQVYVRLVDVGATSRQVTARLAVHRLLKSGQIQEATITVRAGDDLRAKTQRPEYGGYEVEEIHYGGEWIRFANGVEVHKGEAVGADKTGIFAAQIRYTIEQHFRKQRALRDQGIKVLSLFFIDRVDNYALAEGVIRQLFNRTFDELKMRYAEWETVAAETVQAAYFASRRVKGGGVVYEDSRTGESEKDREAYDLIMRDKERLLAFDEPTAFIFSHSALREGWDNPNVFQICTLNQTVSAVRKRQEIGRGVRLAVNQAGERVRDERVNVLTVVANASYTEYVAAYQAETEEAFGRDGVGPLPANARQRLEVQFRKQYVLDPQFKALWAQISPKTRYHIKLDTAKLIDAVLVDLNTAAIQAPRIMRRTARVEVTADDEYVPILTGSRDVEDAVPPAIRPNLIDIMANLLQYTSPPVRLTRQTLLSILQRTTQQHAALVNPQGFATVAVRIIKQNLADQLVYGIQYERLNEFWEMTRLDTPIETWQAYALPADRSVYDHIIYDSEPERQLAEDLERDERVKLYIKLPTWFTVPTPVGEYNPDWAIVMEDRDADEVRDTLYLVRETKSTLNRDEWRPDERRKVYCGERHFRDALQVNYKVITRSRELLP